MEDLVAWLRHPNTVSMFEAAGYKISIEKIETKTEVVPPKTEAPAQAKPAVVAPAEKKILPFDDAEKAKKTILWMDKHWDEIREASHPKMKKWLVAVSPVSIDEDTITLLVSDPTVREEMDAVDAKALYEQFGKAVSKVAGKEFLLKVNLVEPQVSVEDRVDAKLGGTIVN